METNNNFLLELTADPVLIGKWTFYPDILQLECGEKQVKLEPRAACLLFHLSKNAGTPVSRDKLIAKVWPNMVVGDEVLTGAINKLRKAFGDDSHHPSVIETIPKIGYRLIADVEFISRENLDQRTEPILADMPAALTSKRWRLLAIISFLLLLLALMFALFWQPTGYNQDELATPVSDSTLSEKPSIAVLPFTNMSSDKEQDFFVDGLTEDLITDISKISGLFVIARNSVFTYKGESVNVEEVAEELGVRYVLEGSVRRAGGLIRINAQLTDTVTGKHLWAERYDRKLEGVFSIQDEITASIVHALEVRLKSQEKEGLVDNAGIDFDAYELFLQGQVNFRSRDKAGVSESINLYREAIRIDPGFSRAYGAIAVSMVLQYIRGWTESPKETLNMALEMAQKGVSSNSSIPQVYWSLGFVHLFRKELEAAVIAAKKSIEISPNYADGYGLLALIYNHQGNAGGAIESINRGMDLNPYYTFDYPYNLGRAQYLAGKYEDAIDSLNQALEKNQSGVNPRVFLIASYVRLGLIDDAEWEVEQLRMQSPEITISHLRRTSVQTVELMDQLALELRQAGLPE